MFAQVSYHELEFWCEQCKKTQRGRKKKVVAIETAIIADKGDASTIKSVHTVAIKTVVNGEGPAQTWCGPALFTGPSTALPLPFH